MAIISEQQRELREICEVYNIAPTAIARRIESAPSTINRFLNSDSPKNALSSITMTKIRAKFPLNNKKEKLSDGEIALMDAIKDMIAILVAKNVATQSDFGRLFTHQRQEYLRMRLSGATQVMDSLLEYVREKPRESELQAIHKLLQLAPVGSA